MPNLVLSPVTWSRLSDIDDVRPIDDTDGECLEEIRQVLAKHGNLERFGIALLHAHFQVADDEQMVETTDVDAREHWVRPVKRAQLVEAGFETQPTILSFDEAGYHQDCGCYTDKDGHTGGHSF